MSDIVNNAEAKRYELSVESKLAKIEYIATLDKIYLTHTEVPKELEGKGIASKLVKFALEDIEKKDLTLIPLCPFVAMYIKKHPEWKKLVMKGVNID